MRSVVPLSLAEMKLAKPNSKFFGIISISLVVSLKFLLPFLVLSRFFSFWFSFALKIYTLA